MRPITFTVALIGGIFMCHTAPVFSADKACALLTQAQVSATLGVPVDAGKPMGRPTACQWTGKGRFATLTITQPLAGKNAVARFNAGKTSTMPGITIEPTSGVGDDAYYVYYSKTTRAGLGLVMKKGSFAFEIRVYGLDIEKAKSVAKTLCQTVAGKI